MDSLLNKLSERNPDSPLLMDADGTSLAGECLQDAYALREGPLSGLKGRSVTLCCIDTVAYIKLLLALDGWAHRILLVDDSLEDTALESFEGSLGIGWRVCATAGLPEASEVIGKGQESVHETESSEWIIPTSGTTGTPKLITHDFNSLTRSLKPPNEKSANLRWGLIYSPTRFAGIQVLLQAWLGGSAIIAAKNPVDVETAIPLLAQHGCNALSATPSLWRKLAFSGILDALDLEIVTLGGEAADQKILDTLRKHYTNATIRHIYASTEAGVGFSVGDGITGFPSSFLETPPAGIEMKLGDDGMLMLRPLNPAQGLSPTSESWLDDDGWIRSGDLVERRGDRCYFLGRESGAINVGGQKVHPGHVEEILLEVPGVAAARVYGKPNPVLGALVAADLIAEDPCGQDELRKQLATHCKQRLERHQTPALINFVETFNLSPAGKIER
ncbi:MAG: ANL family adenylate-forming protein [Luteolibacter sp.]